MRTSSSLIEAAQGYRTQGLKPYDAKPGVTARTQAHRSSRVASTRDRGRDPLGISGERDLDSWLLDMVATTGTAAMTPRLDPHPPTPFSIASYRNMSAGAGDRNQSIRLAPRVLDGSDQDDQPPDGLTYLCLRRPGPHPRRGATCVGRAEDARDCSSCCSAFTPQLPPPCASPIALLGIWISFTDARIGALGFPSAENY